MIGHLLTQSALWKPKTGSDAYGKATYSADTLITCRWEWKRRMVRSATGQEVVSEARVFLTAPVKTGDQLVDPAGRAVTVLADGIQYGLGGVEQFREVYV